METRKSARRSNDTRRFLSLDGIARRQALADYEELHRYSTKHPAEFWSALWDFAGVVGDKGAPPYLVDEDKMPGARFFLKPA